MCEVFVKSACHWLPVAARHCRLKIGRLRQRDDVTVGKGEARHGRQPSDEVASKKSNLRYHYLPIQLITLVQLGMAFCSKIGLTYLVYQETRCSFRVMLISKISFDCTVYLHVFLTCSLLIHGLIICMICHSDLLDTNMDTGLQGDTTLLMDRDEKGVQGHGILTKSSVLSSSDQSNMDEKKSGTLQQVDNEALNSDVASKDLGNYDVKGVIIDDGSEIPFTSQCLHPTGASLNSGSTSEETRTEPLPALKQKSDSSLDVEVSENSSKDNFENPTLTSDGIMESSAAHEESQNLG